MIPTLFCWGGHLKNKQTFKKKSLLQKILVYIDVSTRPSTSSSSSIHRPCRLQDAQDFAGVCRVAGVQAIACIGGGVGLQGDLPLEPPRLRLPISDGCWLLQKGRVVY